MGGGVRCIIIVYCSGTHQNPHMRAPLLTLALCATALCSAQTFAPIGAKWTYEQHFAFTGDSALVTIESVADTVLQGKACKVLDVTGSIYCTQAYRYVYASNDTVYFWDPTWGAFSTLYILDATLWQSWDMHVSASGITQTAGVTCSAVSTTVIDGVPLRTLGLIVDVPGLYYFGTGNVIERIGDLRYLFPWMSPVCDGDYITALRCYEDPDISWVNPLFAQCELGMRVNEIATSPGFFVSPTLVDIGQVITVSSLDPATRSIEVRDALGRSVVSRNMVNGRTELNLSTAGSYTICALSDGREQVQRVMVR